MMLIAPVAVIPVAENLGHLKAVAGMTGRNMDPYMGRAFVGDGLATMLSGSVGGSGVTTYAENIGVMAVTKVYSTLVFVAAALIAMLLGFSPKFGALIHTIPGPVIGGASIVVFGLIAVAGARIWVQNRVDLSQNSNLIMVSVTRCWAPAISRCRWAALRWAGLARPPSGRSCCTRCFIAGRARRRRPVTPV